MTRNVALIYVRVSRLDREDRDRAREGATDKLRALSPATQIEQCKVLPALRGMKIEVFEDLHRSGKNTNRPGLDRLRARIHDQDVALVAVWSMSRLGRSVVDLHTLVEELHSADVGFVSAKESIDTTTAAGRAFFGILAVLAQFERELTSERMIANVENAARSGALVGQLPAGYRREESGEVVVDPITAPVIQRLFSEYATGKYSFRSLAVWANAEGLKPPQKRRRPGGPEREQLSHFTIDSIRDLLSNLRYTGRFIHRRRANPDAQPIEGNYPALIDPETWSRCVQLRSAGRLARLVPSDRRVTAYALTGLLRCGACGDNVRGDRATGPRSRRYVCRRHRTSGLCREPQVIADRVEGEVRQWLESIRVRPEWTEFYDEQRGARSRDKTPSPQERAKTLEAKLDRLRVSWEAGALTDEAAYRRDVAALREQITAARATPEPAPQQQAKALNSLVDEWDVMTAAQRKRLVSTVFVQITMQNKTITSATPHPDWEQYVQQALGCQPWARRDSNPHALSSTSS